MFPDASNIPTLFAIDVRMSLSMPHQSAKTQRERERRCGHVEFSVIMLMKTEPVAQMSHVHENDDD